MVRSEALLAERMQRLSHQVSDANLAQMPDFRQRVEVLRRLQYVSEDNIVELKVQGIKPSSCATSACKLPSNHGRAQCSQEA